MFSLARQLAVPVRRASSITATTARSASSEWNTPPPPSTKFNEFGVADQYDAGFWNQEQASIRHYFEFDPEATYPGEKELPLQCIYQDEAMGPDVDPDVNPYYALGCLLTALAGVGGVLTLARQLAPECPVAPRELPFDNLSVEYGWKPAPAV